MINVLVWTVGLSINFITLGIKWYMNKNCYYFNSYFSSLKPPREFNLDYTFMTYSLFLKCYGAYHCYRRLPVSHLICLEQIVEWVNPLWSSLHGRVSTFWKGNLFYIRDRRQWLGNSVFQWYLGVIIDLCIC